MIDYKYSWFTHGRWPFLNDRKYYDIQFTKDHKFPGNEKCPEVNTNNFTENDDEFEINMVRTTTNLPNYWELWSIGPFSKLFGIKNEDFLVERWETTDRNNIQSVFEYHVSELRFNFNFVTEIETKVEYTSLGDVLSSTGGLFTSLVGVCLFFYDSLCAKRIKK